MKHEKNPTSILPSTRLEAFSDAVLAVIITLMVLELRPPHTADLAALSTVVPSLVVYILSFHTIATYWNNHHHLFMTVERITPKVMWLNMNLLFWLSLVPFFTAWLGEHYTRAWPAACYAALMLVAGIAYQILERAALKANKLPRSSNWKGIFSLLLYACAAPLAFIHPFITYGLIVLIALWWFIPRLSSSKVRFQN
jgi:uncharacterized membrane protein